MTQPEKKKPQTVIGVKNRITYRFLDELGMHVANVAENYPAMEMTTEEKYGIAAKMALYHTNFDFRDTTDSLQDAIFLLTLQLDTETNRKTAAICIRQLVNLIRLFDWLQAFGPKENPYHSQS